MLTVEVQPLDRLLSSNPSPIALLKIDVEGYERFVVEGAIHTLARTASVYFEAHDPMYARFGYRCGDIIKLLHDRNFAYTDGLQATHTYAR